MVAAIESAVRIEAVFPALAVISAILVMVILLLLRYTRGENR